MAHSLPVPRPAGSSTVVCAAVLAPVALALYKAVRSPAVRAILKRNVASYFSGVLGYLFIIVFVVGAAAAALERERKETMGPRSTRASLARAVPASAGAAASPARPDLRDHGS